jgi:Zn-dependent protease with chaperone function
MSETGWKHTLLQRIGSGVESFAETYPRGYLLALTGFALAGYGWLLLFPWLVLAGVSGCYDALTGQPAVAWNDLFIWSAVAAGSALVTCRLARFRPALPAGILLNRKKAAPLFELVDELRRHYRRPVIDRLVITGAFELELVKTPRWSLPVWSINTLVIGLPLIQSLSAAQFRCALARRLGQFSKRHHPLGNWLYQLRRIWPLYGISAEAAGPGFQPVGWFFSIFAPLYDLVSLPAARIDELAADSYAMEVCSDEEVLVAITVESVCRLYLEEKYWPAYRKLPVRVREAMPKPHVGMAPVLRTGLRGDRSQEWLMKAMAWEPRQDEPMPSLAKRVENIGHLKPRMSEIAPVPAAAVYLGTVNEELDAALGRALPQEFSRESKRYPFRFLSHSFTAFLMHLSRRGHADQNTPAACNHGHITSLH